MNKLISALTIAAAAAIGANVYATSHTGAPPGKASEPMGKASEPMKPASAPASAPAPKPQPKKEGEKK